jgi:hypothetical protein
MRLPLLLALFLIPVSAFAEDTPWFIAPSSGSLTVVHPAPGIDYYTDLHGSSATVLDEGSGLHWYSAHDPQGQITSQGFRSDPGTETVDRAGVHALYSAPSVSTLTRRVGLA